MTCKNNRKKFYTFFILFATLLIGIGYATVNSILLDITGSAKANVQDGIFITEVKYNSNYGADTLNSEIIYAY